MDNKPSNFEQDFINQVSNPQPIDNNPPSGRKPLDKRWIIIGVLTIILIAALIILSIINSNLPKTNNSDDSEGDAPFTASIVGDWLCEGDYMYTFSSDSTYKITADLDLGDLTAEESGSYNKSKNILTLTPSSPSNAEERSFTLYDSTYPDLSDDVDDSTSVIFEENGTDNAVFCSRDKE